MDTNISRRHVIGTLAASPLIASPVAALADLGSRAAPDPIFAAIAEWRALQTKLNETVGDISAADGARYADLTDELFRTVPATVPGLLALVSTFLEDAEHHDEDPRAVLESVAAVLGKEVSHG